MIILILLLMDSSNCIKVEIICTSTRDMYIYSYCATIIEC